LIVFFHALNKYFYFLFSNIQSFLFFIYYIFNKSPPYSQPMMQKTIEITQAPAFEYSYHDNIPFVVLDELGGDEFHRACPQVSPSSIQDLAPHTKIWEYCRRGTQEI